MKLNSAQLDAFSAVAKALHFTKAAEALNVTQSALSQRIAKLEDELGVTLFIRERAAIRLTEDGTRLLRYCEFHEKAEADLLHDLTGAKQGFGGTLRIGGFSSVNRSVVIPALKKLISANPNLSLQLYTKELYELDEYLRRSEADYIITNKKSDAHNIESLFLGVEENVLTRSKRHSGVNVYLDHDESDPTTRGYFQHTRSKFKAGKMRYLDDVYGLIDGVKNGFGMAVLPRHLIAGQNDLEVVEPGKVLRVSVFLQYYAQPYYRPVHAELVQSLKSHFANSLQSSRS